MEGMGELGGDDGVVEVGGVVDVVDDSAGVEADVVAVRMAFDEDVVGDVLFDL